MLISDATKVNEVSSDNDNLDNENNALVVSKDQEKEIVLLKELANASYHEPLKVVDLAEGRFPSEESHN